MIRISLAAARVNAKLTQSDVAKVLKKSKTTVVNWETGKNKVGATMLRQLSDLYNFPCENLILPEEADKEE